MHARVQVERQPLDQSLNRRHSGRLRRFRIQPAELRPLRTTN
jgi:hypothetical protein